ncbi:hypothetical protein N9L29_03485 [Litoricolaceae bacterium]|nr:hypothetical protein [Litorivicinaceae bacterium]
MTDFVLRELSSQDLFASTDRLLLAVLAGDFLDPLQIPTWPRALGGQQDRREAVVYLSDCDGIGPESQAKIRAAKPKAIIVDCSFPPGMGRNHLSLDRATPLLTELDPQWLYLTHIGHDLENFLITNPLPEVGRIHIARDGMTLNID